MEGWLLLGLGLALLLLAAASGAGRRVQGRSITGTVSQGNIKAGGNVTIGAPVNGASVPAPGPTPLWERALAVVGSVCSIAGLILVLRPDLLT